MLSVCAPNASVVYALSPLARSDVKSQNLPSVRGTERIYENEESRISIELTLRLSNKPNPRRELLCRFRSYGYTADKRESEFRLHEKKKRDC